MNISIEQPAPNMEQISAEKENINQALVEQQNLHAKWLFNIRTICLLTVALSSVGMFYFWPEIPIRDFIEAGLMTFLGLGACLIVGCMAISVGVASYDNLIANSLTFLGVIFLGLGVGVGGGGGVAIVFGFGVVVGVVTLVLDDNLEKLKEYTRSSETSLAQLDFAQKETCVEIIKWISEPTVLSYRDSVLEHDRRFIVAEVRAMEDWFNERDKIALKKEKENEIELACREVYAARF